MPRPKIAANADLPPYLSFDKNTGHFRYRHPQPKKTFAFGRDRLQAISAAVELNGQLMKETNLVALRQKLAKNRLRIYHFELMDIKKKLKHFMLKKFSKN